MSTYEDRKAAKIERRRDAAKKLIAEGQGQFTRGDSVFQNIPAGQPYVGSPAR